MALHSSLCLSLAAHKCSREVGNLNAQQGADVFLHKLLYMSWARVETKKTSNAFSPIKRQMKPRDRVARRKMKG